MIRWANSQRASVLRKRGGSREFLFYEVGGRSTRETITKTVVITVCSRKVSTYSTTLQEDATLLYRA
jgi:hypothetical protein